MPCLLVTTGRKLSHPSEHLFDLLGLTCELKFRRIEASDWDWDGADGNSYSTPPVC